MSWGGVKEAEVEGAIDGAHVQHRRPPPGPGAKRVSAEEG